MRLIDADEIEYESVAIEERNGGFRATDIVEQKDIDEMPTIEAITLDWIYTWWAHQGIPSLSCCLENTDEVIRTMLKAWREEQC